MKITAFLSVPLPFACCLQFLLFPGLQGLPGFLLPICAEGSGFSSAVPRSGAFLWCCWVLKTNELTCSLALPPQLGAPLDSFICSSHEMGDCSFNSVF